MALRTIPLFLSCALMAAHAFRAGGGLLALGLLLLPALLLAPWGAAVLRGLLGLFALEWLRTALVLAVGRMASGEPFLRMLLILGAVAAFNLWALALLRRRGSPPA